jgi:pimeloyl-ACP methyl ester carboxylesterase
MNMARQEDTGSWTRGLATVRALGSELSALIGVVGSLPWRSLVHDTLDAPGTHPVPVVLVHGLLGDPTNFAGLRRHLARHGIRRFSSFAYAPRLDYPRLARALHERIDAVRHETGSRQVDVIAHSLGGLVARYLVQTSGAAVVRRLVTLGTPYLAHANPPQELAVFAADDAIVPPPADRTRRRMTVVDACGHLGLLTHPRVLAAVVRHLARSPVMVDRIAGLAA